MAAGSIVIDLLMKTGSFETDTKRAEKRIKDLDKELKSFGKGVAATAAAAATAFAYMAKTSIDNMDNLAKQAQMAGVSVESLSELAYAADLAGVSQDELTASMARLAKGMGEAAQGTGEALKGFQALNLDAAGFKGTDDALMKIADRFSQFKDGAEKTAIAISIFGRSGAQLIPFLNAGKEGMQALTEEARRLGVVVGTDTAKASEQFNDNLTRMKRAVDGIVISIVGDMLPAMNSMLEKMLEIAKLSKESSISAFLPNSSVFATSKIDQANKNVNQLRKAVAELQAQVDAGGGIMSRPSLEANIILLERAEKLLNSLSKKVPIQLGEEFGDQVPTLLGAAPKLGGGGAAKESEYDKYLKSLTEQYVMLGLITEQEKLLAQIQLGKFGKLTEQQRLNLDLAAQNLDAVKKSQEEFKEYSKAIDELTGYTKLKEFTKQMDFLSKALKEGRINADQYTEAVNMLSAKFETTTSEMGQFAIEAARNIQNILGDAMLNVLEGKFSNIGDAFTQMLKKMVAQLAASQLSSLLFGQFDKTGQLGGLIGAAGSAIAGAFNGGFGTGNAYGNQDLGQYFAEGGYTGDGGNMEAAGIVHKGEYVLNAKATQRIGKGRLDMLNGFSDGGYVGGSPSGGMMGGNVNINIKNEAGGDGYQATATARKNDAGFDIDILVRKAMGNDLRNNGPMTQQIGSTFGLRRTA